MVDRDMFMRYRGGGIGHRLPQDMAGKAVDDPYWEDVQDNDEIQDEADDLDRAADPNSNIFGAHTAPRGEDSDGDDLENDDVIPDARDSDEEEDYGYDPTDEDDSEKGLDEGSGPESSDKELVALGAEDGEDREDVGEDDYDV